MENELKAKIWYRAEAAEALRQRKEKSIKKRAKRKEEIAELAAYVKCAHYEQGDLTSDKFVTAIARYLYNAGYRKASEVALEPFEEIERLTKKHGITYTQKVISELKKKYTEDGE
jgi:hypothetical protein